MHGTCRPRIHSKRRHREFTNTQHNTSVACTLAPHENALWRDENGDNLILYLHHFINTDHAAQLQEEIEKLIAIGTLSIPTKQHHRYLEAIEWAKSYPPGIKHGVYEYLIRQAQGHLSDTPVISADHVKTSALAEAAARFFQSTAVSLRLCVSLTNPHGRNTVHNLNRQGI
jgi:hypothetical protein